jgi:hypothetical protein
LLRFAATFEPLRQILDGVRAILYFNASGAAGLTPGFVMTGVGLIFWVLIGIAVTTWYDRKGLYRMQPDVMAYMNRSVRSILSPTPSAAVTRARSTALIRCPCPWLNGPPWRYPGTDRVTFFRGYRHGARFRAPSVTDPLGAGPEGICASRVARASRIDGSDKSRAQLLRGHVTCVAASGRYAQLGGRMFWVT